jgi:single-strand DNA-binding protein
VEENDLPEQVNEVRIRGRVSGPPRHRRIPSGDEVVSIRISVPRPDSATDASVRKRPSVDTVECVTQDEGLQSVMNGLGTDEYVFVAGALRRRFWRAGGVVASVVEVEVSRLRRVPAPSAGIKDRSPLLASDA